MTGIVRRYTTAKSRPTDVQTLSMLPALTLEQTATVLGVSKGTVQNLIKAGRIKYVPIGVYGAWRIARSELEAFLARESATKTQREQEQQST